MKDFDQPKLIGVVFDISSNSQNNGVRNIDLIKDVLLNKILDGKSFSKLYISHPEYVNIPRDQGESTYCLISYKEPPKFSIDEAFKRAVMTVGQCAEDCEKHIFLITDRFETFCNYQYRKSFLMNEVRGFSTKIHVFGLGLIYDKLNLESVVNEYQGNFIHLESTSNFEKEISKFLGE